MNADDDNLLERPIFVENRGLDALIRACLGIRYGGWPRRRPTGLVLEGELSPEFQDTVPTSHPRLRCIDDPRFD